MKRSSKSKILLHGKGTGDLNDDDVEKRARELAVIRGRAADQVGENDRAEAWAELRGDLVPETSDSDRESIGSISRDPSEPVGVPGRQITNDEGEDESTVVERLTTEGVEEAQHDQMLASRDQEHRQDRR